LLVLTVRGRYRWIDGGPKRNELLKSQNRMDIIREISPYPSFPKRGNTSLWQREVGGILKINVVIIIRLLISHAVIL